ncbi:MAG: GlpM family protein [Patescibacteria group bacterium]|nr:GlpM family protein [Patescibacteria group bacterium]
MEKILIYFMTGGVFTALIVVLEESGFRELSGFMTLLPVFTLVSYIFIGQSQGGLAVSQHAKFVLWGTIVSWVPYMIAITYFSPKVGPTKAIVIAMSIFSVLAILFIVVSNHYGLFR